MGDTRIQRRNPHIQFHRSLIKENYNKIKILNKELKEVKDYLNNPKNQTKKPIYYKNFKYYLEDQIKNAKELIKICLIEITKYTC